MGFTGGGDRDRALSSEKFRSGVCDGEAACSTSSSPSVVAADPARALTTAIVFARRGGAGGFGATFGLGFVGGGAGFAFSPAISVLDPEAVAEKSKDEAGAEGARAWPVVQAPLAMPFAFAVTLGVVVVVVRFFVDAASSSSSSPSFPFASVDAGAVALRICARPENELRRAVGLDTGTAALYGIGNIGGIGGGGGGGG